MFRCSTFTTGDFTKRKVFLPDKEYGLALDALVKGCADVLVTRETGSTLEILVGRRCVHPQPDWWFVGGRTRPGETPEEGASRNVERELGFKAPASRFAVVGNYSFVWRYRQQAPQSNGTADISTVLELRLSEEEAAQIDLKTSFAKSEYRDAAWLKPRAILEGEFHPALQQAVRDLLARRAFVDLRDAVARRRSVLGVITAARRLVAWFDAGVTAPVKVVYDEATELYEFKDKIVGAKNGDTEVTVPRPAPQDVVFLDEHGCHATTTLFVCKARLLDALGVVVSPRTFVDALVGPLLGACVGIALYRRFARASSL